MPSKSAKQARFMAAAAHNPAFAKKAGISQSVAEEFNAADERNAAARKKGRTTTLNKIARRAQRRSAY
jgi:hypothetical protein